MSTTTERKDVAIPRDRTTTTENTPVDLSEKANRYAAAIEKMSKNPPPNLPEDIAQLIRHQAPKDVTEGAVDSVYENADMADRCLHGEESGSHVDPHHDDDEPRDDGEPDDADEADHEDEHPDDDGGLKKGDEADADAEPEDEPGGRLNRDEFPQVANLMARAAELHKKAGAMMARALGMMKRTAIDTFQGGALLHEASGILKAEDQYRAWLKTYGIAPTTAWEAIELFRRAKSEDAIRGMTITEAKVAFGVQKDRKANRNGGSGSGKTSKRSGRMVGFAQKRAAKGNSDAPREANAESASQQDSRQTPPSKKCSANEADEAAPVTLPPLDKNFVLTQADEDAFAGFVEATGGCDRAAQVFQAGWKRHQALKEDLHR